MRNRDFWRVLNLTEDEIRQNIKDMPRKKELLRQEIAKYDWPIEPEIREVCLTNDAAGEVLSSLGHVYFYARDIKDWDIPRVKHEWRHVKQWQWLHRHGLADAFIAREFATPYDERTTEIDARRFSEQGIDTPFAEVFAGLE